MVKRIFCALFTLVLLCSQYNIASYADNDSEIIHFESIEVVEGVMGDDHQLNDQTDYEDNWLYYMNASDQLERRHTETHIREVLFDGQVSCMDVKDGIVYGYIEAKESLKLGIYKIDATDKRIELILDREAMNISIIDDWIYFKEDRDIGISRIKIDGTHYEEVYTDNAGYFTVYEDAIYFMSNDKLTRMDINDGACLHYDDQYAYRAFTVNEDGVYACGKKDGQHYLLKLALDGQTSEILFDDFQYYHHKLYVDKGYLYIYDQYLRRTSLEKQAFEMVLGTDYITDYMLQEDQIICEMDNNGTREIWFVDLDTLDEKRIVPRQIAPYDQIKSIIKKSKAAMATVERFDTQIKAEESFTYDDGKDTILYDINVDEANDIAFARLEQDFSSNVHDEEDDIYRIWMMNKKDIFGYSESGERVIEYNQDFTEIYHSLFNVNMFIQGNLFELAKDARLRETKTKYIILINGENKEIQDYIMNVAYLSDFNAYVGDSEYGYQNAYIYMMVHIDKKTYLIDKVKIKAKNNRYSPANIIDVNLKNNYGGERLILPIVIIKDH